MPQAPDTLIVTGPNFEQDLLDYALVTPTGGTQLSLRDALAFGANLTMPGPIGSVIPNTGAFTTLSATGATTLLKSTGRDLTITDGSTHAQISVANGNPLWFDSHLELASVQTPQNATEMTLLGYAGNTIPLSGSQSYAMLKTTASLSGSTTSDILPNIFHINSNGLAEAGPNGLYSVTGEVAVLTGSSGGFTGMFGQVTVPSSQTGLTGLTVQGGQFETTISSAAGGTSGSQSGQAWGLYAQVGLNAGATFWNTVAGLEADLGVQAGASVGYVGGLGAILLPSHASHGLRNIDSAFVAGCANGASTSWDYALRIGGIGSPFGVVSTGTIIQTVYGNSGAPAAYGADFLPVNFSGAAFRSKAFSVAGDGTTQIGTCYLTPTASGATIDCSGSIATAAALASGGTSWPIDGQTHVASDTHGGIYVLTINGSGVVTAISMYRAPYVSGSTPSNPVTLIPDPPAAYGGATGLTVNLTWQARSTLSLNPSGGPIVAPLLTNAANDAAAATAGVAVNQFYRNGSVVMQRVA